MSLDDFAPNLAVQRDSEMLTELRKLPSHNYGAMVDMWQLAEKIEMDVDGLWWRGANCGIEDCGHQAWQLDQRGYRCFYHRSESA